MSRSATARQGGLLALVKHRLKAYVLASGDGGMVSRFTATDDTNGRLQTAPAPDR